MKMRIGRSLTALLLIASMIAASLFQSNWEVVQAAPIKEITEEQLFMQAPLYLNNDAYNNVISRCAGYAGEAIDSVSSEETVMASYMYSLKNGVSYLWNELWAAAGVTDSTYKDFEENAIKDVVFEYMSVSQNVSKAAKNVDKDFKWIDKAYDIRTEVGKNSFREAFQKNYPKLTEEQRGEMIDALFNNADKLMKYAKTGIELFMLTAEILELQAIELQALDDLIIVQNQINDPAMRDALVSLRNEITSGIGTYIVTHYLVDKVLTQVWKEAQKALNGLVASSIEWSSLSWSLGKLIIDVAVTWYEKGNPSVSDMVYSSLLYSYWCCCENAVLHYQCLFLKGEGREDDIRYYEAAMNLDIACMKILLSKSKKLVKKKNEPLYRKMEVWEDALGDSIAYQVYMDGCLRIANQAIADGKLLITDESVTIKDQNGTVIDEHYDSTESIKARFAAIQGEFPPNAGYIWDGDWGGAIQCFGFARMVFYKLFDCNMPNSYVPDARYKYRNENNVVLVGQLSGNNVNNNSVKALLQQGRLGDIIQASGSVYGQHTMVFVSANENGVTVYDCNAHMNSSEPDCLIHQWEVSWNTLSSWYGTGDSISENGISLYRAANYASVYGDGGGLFYDDSVNFVIDENGVLTKYNGWQSVVEIPDTVTAIGENAFKNNTSMMSVSIPDSVTSIGANAFSGCTALIGVTIPDSVETIGSGAFYNCKKLGHAYLPNNGKFVTIKGYTFDSCLSLKEIKIPESITTLESGAFRNCVSLVSVIIPDSVTKMGDEYGSVSNLGAGVFQYCTNLTSVKISKNLLYLGTDSFNGCSSLNNIEIPKSITSVGFYGRPFSNCESLKNVKFEDGITTITMQILEGCTSIEQIEIPDTVTTIEAGAFKGCTGLKSVYIPDSVTKIGDEYGGVNNVRPGGAFAGCSNLESVHLSNRLIYLGAYTFSGCDKLNNVEIPKSITQLGYYGCPFANCKNLKNVSFEKGTIKIMDGILAGCSSVEEIIIPNTVVTIGKNAFSNCDSIVEITIPEACENLGSGIFNDCDSLQKVIVLSKISSIPDNFLYNCKQITEFDIPDSVSKIGNSAFYKCSVLTNIKIPDRVQSIGSYAFYDCDALTRIQVPDTVTSIGAYCFSGCEKLSNIELGTGITRIPQYCFSDCPVLESIKLPRNIKTIENYAFKNDTKLTEITMPRGLSSIGATEVFSYPFKMTIYGIRGTYAEEYAKNNNIKFVSQETNAESVSLNINDISMKLWDSYTLTMSVSPSDHTDAVTWSSSDTSVATVSDTGVIKAVGTGTAVITLTVGSKSASCQVTVPQPVTYISLDQRYVSIKSGETVQLKATIYPENASNQAIAWSSDNEAVAVVDSAGIVTVFAEGTANITAATVDGSNKSASCKITVTRNDSVDNNNGNTENKTGGVIVIKDGSTDGGNTSDVSIRFLIGDSEAAAAQIENHTYSISGLSDGIYTMEASKPDYAARKYVVMVTKGIVEPVDVELHRIGDIDGDGKANMRDLNRVCDHIRGRMDLSDYDFSCGDINGDGLVNTRDLNRLCDHIRKKKMLWN